MPRRPRISTGGYAFHVLNRAVGKTKLFLKDGDYAAFEKVIADIHQRLPTRLLGYCLMPNHWHLVLWPRADGELSEFMRLLTVTHTQRFHAHYRTAGTGPVYQGRFKSFPIQQNDHLLTVLRYVERNALRAKLAETAQSWRWCSAFHHRTGKLPPWLLPATDWPVQRRRDWMRWLNRPQTEKEETAMKSCIQRGQPYGDEKWINKAVKDMALESTLRDHGRPEKQSKK